MKIEAVCNKITQYMNERISEKKFKYLLFFTIFALLLAKSVSCFDSDGYWLIAQGRAIIKNSNSLFENRMNIVSGQSVVIQQWLYCVILALIYDNLGSIGLYLWTCVGAACMWYVFFKFFKLKDVNHYIAAAMSCLLVWLFLYINVRPQWITIVLLVWQCVILEEVISEKSDIGDLAYIPGLVFLEMQLHMSMWVMHFVLLLPYIVPFPSCIIKRIQSVTLKAKQSIALILFMVCALFINPYGADGVLYLFRSKRALELMPISEMQSASVFSYFGILLFITLVLITCVILKYEMRSIDLYMILGLFCLAIIVCRNLMFLGILLLYISCVLFKSITIPDDVSRYLTREFYLIFGCGYVMVFYFIANGLLKCPFLYDSSTYDSKYKPESVVEYLDWNTDKTNVRLFTGFNTGGYLEFCDYKVFMDARPELYLLETNKEADILYDYACITECVDNVTCSPELFQSFIQKYNFDYILVDKSFESLFYYYLAYQTDYDCVVDTDSTALYRVTN